MPTQLRDGTQSVCPKIKPTGSVGSEEEGSNESYERQASQRKIWKIHQEVFGFLYYRWQGHNPTSEINRGVQRGRGNDASLCFRLWILQKVRHADIIRTGKRRTHRDNRDRPKELLYSPKPRSLQSTERISRGN